jgi:thiamine-monophosphate kinase
VRIGIGDDAAVVQPERNRLEVLTTDTLVEGVHWDPRFCSPADIGHKSLAVNLSDIAAMGSTPRAALLSLALPAEWVAIASQDLDRFLDAFGQCAADAKVSVVGGNLTSTPGPMTVTVTVTGAVHERKVLTRSGGRAGDQLFVTGTVGAGLAGLLWLRDHPSLGEPEEAGLATCVRRYRRPDARVRVGELVGRSRAASACMDLSDGLADAVRQVAEASGVGARIESEAVPIEPAAAEEFRRHSLEPVASAVTGGDDYELLFAVPARKRRAFDALTGSMRGLAMTRVGELTKGRDLVLAGHGEERPLPQGFSHF